MAVWVDATVLLRFVTKKPLDIAQRAKELIERGERGEILLRVHSFSVAETVWVLESFYEYEKQRVAVELSSLLLTGALKADDLEIMISALEAMARNSVDFADAYLAVLSKVVGGQVATFDKDFKRLKAHTVEF